VEASPLPARAIRPGEPAIGPQEDANRFMDGSFAVPENRDAHLADQVECPLLRTAMLILRRPIELSPAIVWLLI